VIKVVKPLTQVQRITDTFPWFSWFVCIDSRDSFQI